MPDDYSGDPSSSAKDWVRFNIQDTASPWKFTNNEINGVLSEQPLKHLAAAMLCEVYAARVSDEVDYTNSKLAEQASQKAKAWKDRAAELRARPTEDARLGAVGFSIGGQSLDERVQRSEDTSLTQPDFGQGMIDHPGVVSVVTDPRRRGGGGS